MFARSNVALIHMIEDYNVTMVDNHVTGSENFVALKMNDTVLACDYLKLIHFGVGIKMFDPSGVGEVK